MPSRPVAEGLFEQTASGPRLIGGRRKSDGVIVFPMPEGPDAAHFEATALADRGVLWSYTVQRFRPKSPPYTGDDGPRGFEPFALGYVELADQVIVEARLLVDDFSSLKIGQPMALRLTPFRKDADGADVLTFAFAPPEPEIAMTAVHIIGAGIHAFGRHDDKTGLDQGVFAAREALADAGVDWTDIQFGFGGSSAAGNADAVLPRLGLTGVQFINVANGCATGGSALLSAYWAIKSGEFDLGMVVGFDKHPRGAFNAEPSEWGLPDWYGETGLMLTTQFFANKITRYMGLYGVSPMTLAKVAEKAYENGVRAPHAWRREAVDAETILNAQMVSDPLTKFMFCSPAEGGCALILASDKKMRELGAQGPVIRGAAVRTRVAGSFEVFAPALDIKRGLSPTQLASTAAYEMAGVGPTDIDVAQIQDTESGAEIMHMAENGFCPDGEQERLIAEGATRLGGRLPINTDGGCLACGEPIGASGLRQVYENVQQLRGRAVDRQVEGAQLAYSQVYGAPGLSGVVILGA